MLFVATAALVAALGVWISGLSDIAHRVVPAGGAVLILLALAGVLPELAATFGWPGAWLLLGAALGLVYLVDRHLYPVCPACAPSHDHNACSTRLHGFAVPLLIAISVHNVFDGWMIASGHSLSTGVYIHKVPEGLAVGVLLRAALRSRSIAVLAAIATQMGTLAGALLQPATAAWLGQRWLGALLAFGGGAFLYLGVHAVHGEWKRRSSLSRSAVLTNRT